MNKIDINADLGEGFLFDEELMQRISSCNIACGGHAGNENSMRATIRLALKHGVTIGAHPSYPDSDFFGRRELEIAPELLKSSLRQQIYTLINIAREEGAVVRYIKPHGALYNKAAVDVATANLLVDVVKEIEPSVALMGLPNSIVATVATKNYIWFLNEGFADRKYQNDGTLVSRNQTKAVIENSEDVWNQIKMMIENQEVLSIDKKITSVKTDSICFHGDTPKAVELLSYVCEKLDKNAIAIKNAI